MSASPGLAGQQITWPGIYYSICIILEAISCLPVCGIYPAVMDRVQPDDIGAWMNVGRINKHLKNRTAAMEVGPVIYAYFII